MDLKSTITDEIAVSSPIFTDTVIEVESPINKDIDLESDIIEEIRLEGQTYADVYAINEEV